MAIHTRRGETGLGGFFAIPNSGNSTVLVVFTDSKLGLQDVLFPRPHADQDLTCITEAQLIQGIIITCRGVLFIGKCSANNGPAKAGIKALDEGAKAIPFVSGWSLIRFTHPPPLLSITTIMEPLT